MKCSKCSQRAVFGNPRYCKDHFIRYLEAKVRKTIKDYRLLTNKDRIVVAVSGGKDSTSCLYMLSKWYQVTALAIDEGIAGYRSVTLEDLKRFCAKHQIRLTICSVRDEYGFTLDALLNKTKEKPCTACGALRRHLINKYARKLKATKLATGHNLDDEAQSVLMNLFRNQVQLSARLGPVTGLISDRRFIPRVKPLYLCSEKEITTYAYLMDFGVHFAECPFTGSSYRATVCDLLNEYEGAHPGTKRNIIKSFLKMLPGLKARYRTSQAPQSCQRCGEPSAQAMCKACQFIVKMEKY